MPARYRRPLTRQSLAAAYLDDALKSHQFQLDAQPIVGLRARARGDRRL